MPGWWGWGSRHTVNMTIQAGLVLWGRAPGHTHRGLDSSSEPQKEKEKRKKRKSGPTSGVCNFGAREATVLSEPMPVPLGIVAERGWPRAEAGEGCSGGGGGLGWEAER